MKVVRQPGTPYIISVRAMTKDDLALLRQKSCRARVQKLSSAHKQMVRLFALGYSIREVADELGYSYNSVSLIKSSPAFKDQVAKFDEHEDAVVRAKIDAKLEFMHQVQTRALCRILDAYDEEDSAPISLDMHRKLFNDMADRTGYHRKSTKENININFAAELESAIKARDAMKLIEATE